MTRRTERVEDLLRAELNQLLLREVHDPRVGMASVVAVEVSSDLRRATVKVSVIGEEGSRVESIRILTRAKGFIRRELAHRLRHLKVLPDLVFELDRGAEHSQRISDLLESLHDDDDEGA